MIFLSLQLLPSPLSLVPCLCRPFGLCHVRAYSKLGSPGLVWLQTAPYWDKKMEGFCQDPCLHRPREPVHTKMSQSEDTCIQSHMWECMNYFEAMCATEAFQNRCKQLSSASPGNCGNAPFVCRFLTILTAGPWLFFFIFKECFNTYFHEYFLCEELNSAHHRVGPSISAKVVANILADVTQCWMKLHSRENRWEQ